MFLFLRELDGLLYHPAQSSGSAEPVNRRSQVWCLDEEIFLFVVRIHFVVRRLLRGGFFRRRWGIGKKVASRF